MKFRLLIFVLFLSTTLFSQADYVPNEVLIRFEPKVNVDLFWRRFAQAQSIQVESQDLVSDYMRIWRVHFEGTVEAKDLVQTLWRYPEVQTVQVNHRVKNRATPNDPFYATQWQWKNIAAENGWDISTGGVTANGDTIVVAIIDDGIQLDHPDLAANIWHNNAEIPNNGIDDDGNGYIDDYNGWNVTNGDNDVDVGSHGIEVAGMIGASGNDGVDGTGINWNIKMMTIVGGPGSEAEVIESYAYALAFRKKYNETQGAEGAFVVATNSSWGVDFGQAADAPLWCAMYDTLGVHGILSCGATTNYNLDVDVEGDLPSSCGSEYLIMVTATDTSDYRSFAGYGLQGVDLAAPGDEIYTTVPTYWGSEYDYSSGTSFSSPIVAGAVALLYSNPCTKLSDLALSSPASAALLVRDYLFNGIDTTSQLLAEIKTGGRLNIGTSMELAQTHCTACAPPFGLQTQEILDTSVNISFTTWNDGANLFFRKVGAASWDTVYNVSSPYHLGDLTACTDYIVQMESICADSTSSLSESMSFKTDGCCKNPADFQVQASQGSIDIEWNSVLAASGYNIVFSAAPYNTWDTVTVTGVTSYSLLGVQPCTKYQLKIRTICGAGLDYSSPDTIQTKGCGACLDLDYCAISSDNNGFEWISQVEVEDVFVNATDAEDNGYGLYSDLGIVLKTTTPYQLILTPGYASSTYSEYIKVWVDIDQNGLFDDSELIIDPDFTITEATTFPFEIPESALPGLTRMRVIMSYSEITSPCKAISYGEIEDYCVTIKDAIYCGGIDSLMIDDLMTNSAKLSWAVVDSSISYVLKYRKINDEWESISTTSTGYLLSGLDACSEYEARVRAICSDGLGDQVSNQFKTECATGSSSPFGKNKISIQPNPFSDYLSIRTTAGSGIQIRLLDVFGREIPVSITKNQEEVTVSPIDEIPSGLYFVELRTADDARVFSVIRERL